MSQWIQSSFRNRIFAAFLLITVVPLLLCNVLMLQFQVNRANRDQLAEAEEVLEESSDRLNTLCTRIESSAERLADSTVVRSVLRNRVTDSGILYQVLSRETSGLTGYARVELYHADGMAGYTTEDAVPMADMAPDWGILYAAGQTLNMAFRRGTDGVSAFLAARTVRNFAGEPLGYIVVTVTWDALDRLLGDCTGVSGDLLLVDPYWQSVYSSRPAKAEETADWLRGEILAGREPRVDAAGENRFFIRTDAVTGYRTVLQQPMRYSAHALHSYYGISVTLGVLCLALCLIYTLLLSRNLSNPIYAMSNAMTEVEKGDFSVRMETGRKDELGHLAESFNRMVEEYHENLLRSVENQRELNETRIRMMQAQLNPHFLYNTLDSMKWLGVTNGVPRIAELAENLASLLRASISQEEFFTLEQELDLIDRYLEIQYIRFEDRFTCEVEVDERFQHCRIPKLALQPVVENAIIHGVGDMDEGYIKITAKQEGQDLLLIVQDNGCGIPEETLEMLNSGKRLPGKHLGLFNVDQILRLYFGTGYGIRAESLLGMGSRVSLRIPMNETEEMPC